LTSGHLLAQSNAAAQAIRAGDQLTRPIDDAAQWLTANAFEIGLALVAGAVIFVLLLAIRNLAVARARKAKDRDSLVAIVWRVLAQTSKIVLAIVAMKLVAGSTDPPKVVEDVIDFLFTVAAVFQAAIWAREIILGLIHRRAGIAENDTLDNAMTLIRLLVSVAVFAIALIVVLDNLGVNVTGLVAGLGIGGIAIGLAAQGIFADLFAALAIIFDKPFQRGEMIRYETTTATVEKIGLKSTRLRSVTGEEVIISNKNLLDKEIINFTRLHRRRTKYTIGVIYQTSRGLVEQIPQILRDAVGAAGATFVRAGFVGFGASAINFEVDFDVMSDDFEVVFEARHQVGLAIIDRFRAEGIEFAYPTTTSFTAAPDGELVLPYPAQESPPYATE